MRPFHQLITVMITAVTFGMTVRAADIYVSPDAIPGTPYDTWANGFNTVQDALNHASPGDTIYVAGRTFTLAATLSWTKADITLIGGFEAVNPTDQPGTPDPEQWPTVFTGPTRIVGLDGADDTTIENVRLTGGTTHTGGGIRIDSSTGVELIGCVIDKNKFNDSNNSALPGAGIYVAADSELTLTHCRVENNQSRNRRTTVSHAQGGGIWCAGTLTVIDSRILNNSAITLNPSSALTHGGGIYFDGLRLMLRNTLIAGNTAADAGSSTQVHGHGLYVAGGEVALDFCTVADNIGDGIYLAGGTMAVSNSIVWGNLADIDTSGGGLTVSFSNVGDTDFGGNNCNDDPLFVYGYYLAAGSPCKNAGSDTAVNLGMDAFSKNTAGDVYAGGETVNLGFHYPEGFDLTYADLYVAPDGNDGNSGTNALQPFATMTHALTLAREGTRIQVATGSYTRASGETFPLVVPRKPSIHIVGADAGQTVFDATGAGELRVITMIYAHRSVLEGVTLTGGEARQGAGLYILQSRGVAVSNSILSNNTFSASSSGWVWSGAGIHAEASAVVVTACRVADNFVENRHNGGHAHGAGIWVGFGGDVILKNSRVDGNTAQNPSTAMGGGVYNAGSRLTVRNTLLAENKALSYGGGGLFFNAGVSTLENCTAADNEPDGIRQEGGAVAGLNSILWGNGIDSTGTVTLAYSIIENSSDYTDGGNNLADDPLFVDAPDGNYRLQRGSPAIDTGSNQAWMAGATDLDGLPRVMKAIVDRGCHEIIPPPGSLILFK